MDTRAVETSVDIEATPRWVWRVLTSLSAYAQWNPFIRDAHGRVEPGRTVTLRIEPPRLRGIGFRARVTSVVDEREVCWEGTWGPPLILRGRHIMQVRHLGPHRVLLRQRHEYRGILVSLLWSTVAPRAETGMKAMNLALKRRAERVDRIASFPKTGRYRGRWYRPGSDSAGAGVRSDE